jgi:hypothetical protein
MPVTVTLGQLVLAESALYRLASQPLAVKAAYRVGRLLKHVRAETATFHDQRTTFIKELGQERDVTPEEAKAGLQGPLMEVTPDHVAEFNTRMKDLAGIEMSLTDWLLTVDLLGDLKVTAVDMMLLDPLITDVL